MRYTLKSLALACAALGTITFGSGATAFAADSVTFRYGHMNAPNSVAGKQAELFAGLIAKKTNGAIKVRVYPSSQLGKLQELAEGVSAGSIAMSHNTAAGIGSLYGPFAGLDTPYLYRDVDHLMKVVDTESPVMKKLNEGLVKAAGARVLYSFYFGTRQLTANKAIRTPADLKGVKIRAIPFPIYMTTVEGLGAVPVPVDWSEVPTALATGVVMGQENPIETIYASKIYEHQTHVMLTGHIMGAEMVVINEQTWQNLSPELQAALTEVAAEVRAKATQMTLDAEKGDLEKIQATGTTIIGPSDGLKVDEFRAGVKVLVKERLEKDYGEIYKEIDAIK